MGEVEGVDDIEGATLVPPGNCSLSSARMKSPELDVCPFTTMCHVILRKSLEERQLIPRDNGHKF